MTRRIIINFFSILPGIGGLKNIDKKFDSDVRWPSFPKGGKEVRVHQQIKTEI
jgi:hypothetical protein